MEYISSVSAHPNTVNYTKSLPNTAGDAKSFHKIKGSQDSDESFQYLRDSPNSVKNLTQRLNRSNSNSPKILYSSDGLEKHEIRIDPPTFNIILNKNILQANKRAKRGRLQQHIRKKIGPKVAQISIEKTLRAAPVKFRSLSPPHKSMITKNQIPSKIYISPRNKTQGNSRSPRGHKTYNIHTANDYTTNQELTKLLNNNSPKLYSIAINDLIALSNKDKANDKEKEKEKSDSIYNTLQFKGRINDNNKMQKQIHTPSK